ncbi:HAD family hydrolase [Mycolicibacterium arenosum]|uniref:HAD family hydrolase n=1 Tax=Mycolicibacterium arenosum TaxID=2952157 RepID=A0ABT1LVW9_9MYCO|nr:HAD family hydrolase [Mycolicibacterium sp. CAU 1645]MCP9270740.1 HAD family hydrolase [Mycolicibacterium sp. CAU 1645]
MTAAPAVLFDIDGTLVDSNYLHVFAWQQAFDDIGVTVDAWRIHRGIGMDGTRLVTELCPDLEDVDAAKDAHSRRYEALAPLLHPLPGALELLDAVAAAGLQVVLATSAPEDELATLREVLGRDDIVSAITSSEDVDTAKPQPDIVAVALQRADVPADRAVFVGDAVWDVRAATRAGVATIALRSGGYGRAELESEGAAAVYDDPADLLEQFAASLLGKLASA